MWQRCSVLGALDEHAQRRIAAQIAGLDHDPAVGRGGTEQRLDRRRDVARANLDPDGAPATKQWNGVGLLDQPRRLAGELVAIKAREREGIVDVVDRGADQRLRTFAHQA